MDGVSGRPGIGSTGTQPPASPTAATGGWLLGTLFLVTGGVKWLNGYYFWVATGGDTGAQKFALWNVYGSGLQSLVAGSVVTSGTLTANSFNYVPLATPIQLAPGETYVAATGWTAVNGITLTAGQFGTGQPYVAGITNGPLTAPGSVAAGGTNTYPWIANNPGEGLFSNVLGADPSVAMPNNVSGSDLFWVDVQVSDTAPAGYSGSYRLRPNAVSMANTANTSADTANNFTLGIEFSVSQSCHVNNVWFYSPSGLTQLPTSIGVFRVSDQVLMGSNSSPSWSGAAGSGWIKAALAGVTLAPGVNYKAVVLNAAGTPAVWNDAATNYWNPGGGATGGWGGSGLTAGPLSFPATSGATPGQDSYNAGAVLTYPNTNAGPFDYGVDIEVTPAASGSGLLMASFP